MLISALRSKSFLIMSGLFCITPSWTGVLPPKAGMSRFAFRLSSASSAAGWSLTTAVCIGAAPLLLLLLMSALASSSALIAPTSPLPQALCSAVYPLLFARFTSASHASSRFTAFSASLGAPAARYRAWKPELSWKLTSAFDEKSSLIASQCPSSAAARRGVRLRVTQEKWRSSSSTWAGKLTAFWLTLTSHCDTSFDILSVSFRCAASKSWTSFEIFCPSIRAKRLLFRPRMVIR
mmetsp:Transcript_23756/g.66726  ORF Transcript_23756/g.66726 Transcript_23756/m.66726 type:complete len:236 (+) Transcript_23756:303-1010(+)